MKIKSFIAASVFALLMIFPSISNAQFGDPDPDPPAADPVPFDAGLTVLIGAGIAYAAKKRHDKRKVEQVNKD